MGGRTEIIETGIEHQHRKDCGEAGRCDCSIRVWAYDERVGSKIYRRA